MATELARLVNSSTGRWERRTSVARKLLPGDVIRLTARDLSTAYIVTKVTNNLADPFNTTVEMIGWSKPIRFPRSERLHIDRRYPS